MKYIDYRNNEKRFRFLTDLSQEQFGELLPYFKEAHNAYFSQYSMNGKYYNHRLVYQKNNSFQEYLAACFEMDQKQCNNFIHVLHRILEQCLHDAIMPVGNQKKFAEILRTLLGNNDALLVLFHNGMERGIPRPVGSDEQQENYSGKQKKHTLKNAVIITACCLILFVSPGVSGKMHGKKTADTMSSFSKPCILYMNIGYQGREFRSEGIVIEQPVKKPKRRRLASEEKVHNRQKRMLLNIFYDFEPEYLQNGCTTKFL